jgi:4'-phosphopantetheinyl transferase
VGYAGSTTCKIGECVPGIRPIDHVDLWTVSLTVDSEQYDRLSQSLSTDEIARADRFKFERDRRRFVVGRGALRRILASYLERDPKSIHFVYGPHGKPMLADAATSGGLEFNASGSDELAVCAVTAGRPVGVDIELCRPIADGDLPDQCLTPAERTALSALEPARRLAGFYRLWTLKEAFLKATGDGLSRPMSSVEFDMTPDGPIRLVGAPKLVSEQNCWDFLEFAPGPQYLGAVVVSSRGCTLNYRTWPPDCCQMATRP